MKTQNLIIIKTFPLLLFLISISIPIPYIFAQEESFKKLSTEEIKESLKSSAAGKLSIGPEAQKYYRFLSDSQKQTLIEGLSSEDKVRVFERLSDSDRRSLFRILSNSEKRNLFKSLSDFDKRKVFNVLTDADKKNLFSLMDDADKTVILSTLDHSEKIRLINSLPEKERGNWLKEYPELDVISPVKGVPSEKPFEGVMEDEGPPLSNIEKILSGQFPTDISLQLRQFGYDYFDKDILSFVPESLIPVGPDYIIGPDDKFNINLWGRAEASYYVTVSRDGRITLPRLGTLNVGGLTLSELKRFLLHKFKEYYPDFEMSITMGVLRTCEVFIIGESESPGTYSLNALSTVISALFASGGPTKRGSLRNINVFNNGELIKTIDLYEFFIKGTKGNDIRLQQGYTIFIPVLGPVVGIAGLVKRPAIYEMKGTQTIGEIIDLAGGVLPTGHLQNVVVERVIGHQRRVINSFNLDPSYEKVSANLKTVLQDGDVIKIYPVHKRLQKVVYLGGHVKYPREYELKLGMRLLDIIPSYDSLLPEPYLPQAEITRLMPPDFHPEIVEFNLGSLLAGNDEHNLLLKDQDRVKIYGVWEKMELPEVSIKGSVRNPGIYRLYRGMTIKDLIFQAGNLTRKASKEKADLTRIVRIGTSTDIVKMSFSPQGAIEGIPEDNMVLQGDDQVHIREIPKYSRVLERRVFLEGEFLFPGEYTFSEGERLLSVIERAGGLTEEAYPFGALFYRESVKEIQKARQIEYISKLEQDILTITALSAETALDASQASILQQTLASKKELIEKLKAAEPTGRMVLSLPEILLMPSSGSNLELRPGDRLIVTKRPDSVNALGEVYNPTALLFNEGKNVGYYLNQVGGATDNADKKQIYIVKANGSVISKRQGKLFGMVTWDNSAHRWTMGAFDSIVLDPGDSIVVPKKIIKLGWLRLTKDISQILYQLAITTGVLDTTLGLF